MSGEENSSSNANRAAQETTALLPPDAEPPATCGNCRLWGANFYDRRPGWPVNTTCCADVVMELPASFIPNRQTMRADQGAECCAWQAIELKDDAL